MSRAKAKILEKHPIPWTWDWIEISERKGERDCRIADADGHMVPIKFTEYDHQEKEDLVNLVVQAINKNVKVSKKKAPSD